MLRHILLIISFLPLFAHAQESLGGQLLDSISGKPIESVMVILKQNDRLVNYLSLTENVMGKFSFKIQPVKQYDLYIYAMGYQNKELHNLSSTQTALGSIYLNPRNISIGEVTVKAETKSYEELFDRKIYSVPETQKATSHSVLDLLRNIPSIVIDGNIIRYKGDIVSIQVNRTPLDYLYSSVEAIPVDLVSKVEIIDMSNALARMSGIIINFKMKKMTTLLSGYLSAPFKTCQPKNYFDVSDILTNINYKLKKVIFFSNITYRYHVESNIDHGSTTGQLLDGNDTYQTLKETTTVRNNYNVLGAYSGARWEIDSLSEIVLSTFLPFSSPRENMVKHIDYSQSLADGISPYSFQATTTKNFVYSGPYLAANYTKNFKQSGRELLAGIFSDLESYKTSYEYLLSTDNNVQNITGDGCNIHGYVYYNHPYKDWNINGNYSINYNNASGKNPYTANDVLQLDKYQENHSIELSHQFNLNIVRTIKNWTCNVGLGSTYRNIDLKAVRFISPESGLQTLNKSYDNLLFTPIFSLKYNYTGKQSIQFKYLMSNELPAWEQLLDYTDKSNPIAWVSGNSTLRPSVFQNFRFDHNYTTDTFSIASNIFYKTTQNAIQSISYSQGNGVFLSKPTNIARSQELGITLSTSYKPSNKTTLTGFAFYSYSNFKYNLFYKDVLIQNKNNDFQSSFSANTNLNQRFGNDYSANLMFRYNGKTIFFDGLAYPRFTSSIDIGKRIFEKKLKIVLGVDNLLSSANYQKSTKQYLNISNTTYQYGSKFARMYKITLSYIFNKGDNGTKNYR